MNHSTKESQETLVRERRDFLRKAGTVAVTAPAVGLLLSVNSINARADDAGGYGCPPASTLSQDCQQPD